MQPNLSVTVVANSRSLCLLADAKSELGITDSSEDTKLGRLIVAASLQVASVLGELGVGRCGVERYPWLQTYLEKRPGDGGVYLECSQWPLKAKPASITLGTGASPATVTAADYSVAGPRRDRIYMANGWNLTLDDPIETRPINGDRSLDYNLTYTAGWVMPDELTAWSASAAVVANEWYKATDADHPLVFQAGGAGTTDATEPSWPTVEEGTVVDNDITWTAYAQRVPEAVEEAALMLVRDWFVGGLTIPSGVKQESFESMSVTYADNSTSAATSHAVRALLRPYA